MRPLKPLIAALECNGAKADVAKIAQSAGVSHELVSYWNRNLLVPSEAQLQRICRAFNVSLVVVKLRMGIVDESVRQVLMEKADLLSDAIGSDVSEPSPKDTPQLIMKTDYGSLYQGDCLSLMQALPAASFDLIFADPPFNLNKNYPSKINDALKDEDYLLWCFSWVDECVRLLADGGSFFIYNLPKWNTALAEYLNTKLTFRDWITVDIKFSLPIPNRLYPSHYSLLYYAKGERPKTFKPDRLPMEICPHCMRDLKDYGGYKAKMNSLGVNLSDVWYDIPPVRHQRHKKRSGANELSIKLLDRVIEFASKEGDRVFDPFGGSGSTYVVSEIKKRYWTGVEIGPVAEIEDRLKHLEAERDRLFQIRNNYNCLFRAADKHRRKNLGLWTDESVREALPASEESQQPFVLCDKEAKGYGSERAIQNQPPVSFPPAKITRRKKRKP